jgi:DNA modification methylase
MSTARPVRRKRRALSHVGGAIVRAGDDPATLDLLARALSVRSDEAATLAHVHGFHSYPARLHPETAARLISGLSASGNLVLDPFAGSGTVLVEARRLERRGVGMDANPLAIELAWLKTRGFDAKERARLLEAGKDVAAKADERRRAKAGPTRRYGAEDRALFDIHVLLELDGLRAAIEKLEACDVRRALRLVLSAILTKVSRRPGDTTESRVERRLAGGFAIRFFLKKSEELARRLLEYSSLLPAHTPAAKILLGDARKLSGVRPGSVRLVVTSPPYPGVYDYRAHHAVRARWLGLDDRRFERDEIGSRRGTRGKSYDEALATWERDFGACLREMRRALAPDGAAALMLADTALGQRPLAADGLVKRLAPRAGLRLSASASQARPHFHGPTAAAFRRERRREHLLLLRPA